MKRNVQKIYVVYDMADVEHTSKTFTTYNHAIKYYNTLISENRRDVTIDTKINETNKHEISSIE